MTEGMVTSRAASIQPKSVPADTSTQPLVVARARISVAYVLGS